MNLSQNPQQQIWEKMQRSCIFVASSFVTNICFLANFTELEITKIQENYWWGQMHCGHPAKILGGPRPTRPTLQRRHAALLCIVSIVVLGCRPVRLWLTTWRNCRLVYERAAVKASRLNWTGGETLVVFLGPSTKTRRWISARCKSPLRVPRVSQCDWHELRKSFLPTKAIQTGGSGNNGLVENVNCVRARQHGVLFTAFIRLV